MPVRCAEESSFGPSRAETDDTGFLSRHAEAQIEDHARQLTEAYVGVIRSMPFVVGAKVTS